MKLTRSDLAMILEEMDKNNVDNIRIDVGIRGYDYELEYVDFDMYITTQHGEVKYIDTLLTLE